MKKMSGSSNAKKKSVGRKRTNKKYWPKNPELKALAEQLISSSEEMNQTLTDGLSDITSVLTSPETQNISSESVVTPNITFIKSDDKNEDQIKKSNEAELDRRINSELVDIKSENNQPVVVEDSSKSLVKPIENLGSDLEELNDAIKMLVNILGPKTGPKVDQNKKLLDLSGNEIDISNGIPRKVSFAKAFTTTAKQNFFGERDVESGEIIRRSYGRRVLERAAPATKMLFRAYDAKREKEAELAIAAAQFEQPSVAEAITDKQLAEQEAETTYAAKPAMEEGASAVMVDDISDSAIRKLESILKPSNDNVATRIEPEATPSGEGGGGGLFETLGIMALMKKFGGAVKGGAARLFGGKKIFDPKISTGGLPANDNVATKIPNVANDNFDINIPANDNAPSGPKGKPSRIPTGLKDLGKGLIRGLGKGGLAGLVGGFALDFADKKLEEAGHEKLAAGAGIASSALSGAGIGATIGSVIPGVGTAIGGAVGGLVGGGIGLFQNKDRLFKPEQTTPQTDALVQATQQNSEAKIVKPVNPTSATINSVNAPQTTVNNNQPILNVPTTGPRGSLDLATFS